eukprot:751526-Hanusia_phi.AAC.1
MCVFLCALAYVQVSGLGVLTSEARNPWHGSTTDLLSPGPAFGVFDGGTVSSQMLRKFLNERQDMRQEFYDYKFVVFGGVMRCVRRCDGCHHQELDASVAAHHCR